MVKFDNLGMRKPLYQQWKACRQVASERGPAHSQFAKYRKTGRKRREESPQGCAGRGATFFWPSASPARYFGRGDNRPRRVSVTEHRRESATQSTDALQCF